MKVRSIKRRAVARLTNSVVLEITLPAHLIHLMNMIAPRDRSAFIARALRWGVKGAAA